MLLEAGANPLIADRNNMTAIMHAQIMHPTKGIVELISHFIQNQGNNVQGNEVDDNTALPEGNENMDQS